MGSDGKCCGLSTQATSPHAGHFPSTRASTTGAATCQQPAPETMITSTTITLACLLPAKQVCAGLLPSCVLGSSVHRHLLMHHSAQMFQLLLPFSSSGVPCEVDSNPSFPDLEPELCAPWAETFGFFFGDGDSHTVVMAITEVGAATSRPSPQRIIMPASSVTAHHETNASSRLVAAVDAVC